MTTLRTPTFAELLKKVKQPKPPAVSDAVTPSQPMPQLPEGWQLSKNPLPNGGMEAVINSPRGLNYKNIKLNPNGSIASWDAFSSEGKPIKPPMVSGRMTSPINPFPDGTIAGREFLKQPSGEPVRDTQGNIVFTKTAQEKYQQQLESEQQAAT